MLVRPAELVDLNACYAMDASFVTDYVWQMQTREEERAVEIRFHTVRLPRPMKVAYPRTPDELLPNWRQKDCFLVTEDDTGQIIAYMDMESRPWHDTAWIRNLVVERHHRRQGIATMLLHSAKQWALENKLSHMMVEAQTKNFPGISLCQKHGFDYCGYNDHYYVNGDIVLFFSLSLR